MISHILNGLDQLKSWGRLRTQDPHHRFKGIRSSLPAC